MVAIGATNRGGHAFCFRSYAARRGVRHREALDAKGNLIDGASFLAGHNDREDCAHSLQALSWKKDPRLLSIGTKEPRSAGVLAGWPCGVPPRAGAFEAENPAFARRVSFAHGPL